MNVIFIRHGKTIGNINRKYIGKTDENLADIGISEIKEKKYPYAEIIVSNPLKRCIQTANIIYGKIDIIENDLKECDFGLFENKSYEELKDNEYYIKWLESGGNIGFPMGENKKDFSKRCCDAFHRIIINNKNSSSISFVINGGTIMSILEKYFYPSKNFYDFQIDNSSFLEFKCLIDTNNNIKVIN